MRNTGLMLIALIVSLLMVVPAMAAVNNVSLSAVENSGISGSVTTIAGSFGGVTPHTHVEVNVMMSRLPDSNMIYEAWLVDNQSNAKQSLGALDGRLLNANLTLAGFDPNGPWDAVAISMEPASDTNPAPARIVSLGNLPGNSVSASTFMTAAVLPPDESFQRQVTMQRFGLTSDQVTSMRMQGIRYREINLVASVAARCGQDPQQVLDTYMRNGTEPSALAQMCNTTVASVLTPFPTTIAVVPPGGSIPGTVGVGTPTVHPPMWYRMYPNGTPVLTLDQWRMYWRRGYSWNDVAIAANIASMTGESIDDLLRMVRVQGQTWHMIIMDRGLSWDSTTDVSTWPFGTNGEVLGSSPGMTGAGAPSTSTY